MLVLTRRARESVRIGPDVRVTIVALGQGKVRIAIEAPEQMAVHREEVYERIARANQEAARAALEFDADPLVAARGPDGTHDA